MLVAAVDGWHVNINSEGMVVSPAVLLSCVPMPSHRSCSTHRSFAPLMAPLAHSSRNAHAMTCNDMQHSCTAEGGWVYPAFDRSESRNDKRRTAAVSIDTWRPKPRRVKTAKSCLGNFSHIAQRAAIAMVAACRDMWLWHAAFCQLHSMLCVRAGGG